MDLHVACHGGIGRPGGLQRLRRAAPFLSNAAVELGQGVVGDHLPGFEAAPVGQSHAAPLPPSQNLLDIGAGDEAPPGLMWARKSIHRSCIAALYDRQTDRFEVKATTCAMSADIALSDRVRYAAPGANRPFTSSEEKRLSARHGNSASRAEEGHGLVSALFPTPGRHHLADLRAPQFVAEQGEDELPRSSRQAHCLGVGVARPRPQCVHGPRYLASRGSFITSERPSMQDAGGSALLP